MKKSGNDCSKLEMNFGKYREAILYIFFGGCTTFVNIIVYYICAHLLLLATAPSTVIAWILSVAFAYLTNRIYVFKKLFQRTRGDTQGDRCVCKLSLAYWGYGSGDYVCMR